ncbi:gas1-like protein [Apiospora hydei]|uniref:Gas1-like protein n=1 Tax=Apiospora hydei TaxID=1337664 RepID=A0ABR1VL92_9PEZI
MPSIRQTILAAAFAAVVHGQGVIVKAQGPKGPASLGLLVDPTKPDANVIRQQEIVDNVVNECGRTLLAGNMDIGENTEIALKANQVTQVTKGANVDVTIRAINADGKGPYICDMDMQSNAAGAVGQVNLTVAETTNNNGDISLKVKMPANMACIGASTGDVCTVRCRNAAANGPFGGCFAVQQTDTQANKNTPQNIKTAQTLKAVQAQIAQNVKDFPAYVKANQKAPTSDDQGVFAVNEVLGIDSKASATAGAAGATPTGGAGGAAGGATGGNRGGNKNGNGANRGGNGANGANRGGKANAGNGAGAGNANAGGATNGAARGGNAANGANRGGNAAGAGNGNGRGNNAAGAGAGNGNGRGNNAGNNNNRNKVRRNRIAFMA